MTFTKSVGRVFALLILALACFSVSSGAQAQVRWQNSAKCTFSGSNCSLQFPIPAGQRLNVAYISTYCNAPAGAVDMVQIGPTFNGGGSLWQAVALDTANAGVTMNSSQVNIYADQNTTLYVNIERLSGAWSSYFCDVLISGHIDNNVTQ